jgi:hypothetical protein
MVLMGVIITDPTKLWENLKHSLKYNIDAILWSYSIEIVR